MGWGAEGGLLVGMWWVGLGDIEWGGLGGWARPVVVLGGVVWDGGVVGLGWVELCSGRDALNCIQCAGGIGGTALSVLVI